jgi:hypothetical protein
MLYSPWYGTAVDGAAAHGQHPAGLGHLVVEHFDAIGHLFVDGAGHNHQIRLAGRCPEDHAEAVKIVARGAGSHHLDRAAGDTKEHVPE